jgi:D-tyrosyl-tRNA(Tyr) deacylase
VVQRVKSAEVRVGEAVVGRAGRGLLVLLGVGVGDTQADAVYLAEKITYLRVFEDEEGKMNRSLIDVGGAMLVVSQFTLYGDCRRGRRPSYTDAAPPDRANQLYEYFVAKVREFGVQVETGVFQEMMDVELVNYGPVTILLDSRKVF